MILVSDHFLWLIISDECWTRQLDFASGPFGPANQGQFGPNCQGNRRNRPECQGGLNAFVGGGGGAFGPNCSGSRRHRPECNFHTQALTDESRFNMQDSKILLRF